MNFHTMPSWAQAMVGMSPKTWVQHLLKQSIEAKPKTVGTRGLGQSYKVVPITRVKNKQDKTLPFWEHLNPRQRKGVSYYAAPVRRSKYDPLVEARKHAKGGAREQA